MNMPGFTAEASLHKAVASYPHASVWVNTANASAIIAQRFNYRGRTVNTTSKLVGYSVYRGTM